MSDLRIGVVGFGKRGSLAKHAHRPGQGSAVVAVCDPEPDTPGRASDAFGDAVTVAESLPALLEIDLDAAFVLSPDWLHEEQAAA
ncbi:MAG TPA: Gfo/Idh/MocA family oxidoreductase, partial [Actinopolymorphaceae bacterium]